MKSSSRCWVIALFAALLVLVANLPASADTYHTADFSGAIFGGNANCQPPFDSIISQGGPVSGSFVFDDQLVPTAGSGYINVFFSSFPDSALIPAATAFTINLGAAPVTFTLADAMYGSGAIQYHNGQFNGFFFVTDFLFSGSPYRFDDQGGLWSISLLDQIGGSPIEQKVSGYLNFSLTTQPFAPVPVPPTLLLLGSGLVGLLGFGRKFKKS